MSALMRVFPDHSDEIERRRSIDLVFAEICRDYELLVGLLPCSANDPMLTDINDSLAGLEREIRSHLRHPVTPLNNSATS